jgi:hypothetical protein
VETLIHATFAARFWPGAAAVGRRFQLADSPHREWFTVIGVVADFKGDNNLKAPIAAAAYLPYPYQPVAGNGFVVRSRMPPATLAALIRGQVHAADPGLTVYRVAAMERLHADDAWSTRLSGGIFVAFGALALLPAPCPPIARCAPIRSRSCAWNSAAGRRRRVLGAACWRLE